MTNTYRALSPQAVAAYSDGVFEREFSPSEEQDALNSGLLELVPRKYRVLSNNYAAGKQGDVVELALLKENEAALVFGGHLERVDDKPVEKTPPADEPAADAPAAKKASK
jgi:hypothetical protein